MGMDFNYAGSSSYPRFDRELCAIAEVLGGIKTEHLKEREATENEHFLGHWFGFMSSDDSSEAKFIFPEGTNKVLVKWFNNIYGFFTPGDTKVVWSIISEHPEIKDISGQIWYELETCNECNSAWHID